MGGSVSVCLSHYRNINSEATTRRNKDLLYGGGLSTTQLTASCHISQKDDLSEQPGGPDGLSLDKP